MSHEPASPFDNQAPGYDADFSATLIGTLMRQAVRRRMDALFHRGQRVLDLGCGTGEDAVYLAGRGVDVHAVDASEGMLRRARQKVAQTGVEHRVEVSHLDIENLDALGNGRYDGVLSNFGALNCVEDLPTAARQLAERTDRGAPLLLCLMGPIVPWEWIWHLAHGEPAKAFRRLRPGGVAWRGIRVWYPSIGQLRRAFAPYFDQSRVAGLGALVPPPCSEPWARRHRALVEWLAGVERRFEAIPPLPWLADHYMLELRRR